MTNILWRNTSLHEVKTSDSALRIGSRYIKQQYPLAVIRPVEAVKDPDGSVWRVKLKVKTNPQLTAFIDCDLVLRAKTGQIIGSEL